jgi:hypothetical protein
MAPAHQQRPQSSGHRAPLGTRPSHTAGPPTLLAGLLWASVRPHHRCRPQRRRPCTAPLPSGSKHPVPCPRRRGAVRGAGVLAGAGCPGSGRGGPGFRGRRPTRDQPRRPSGHGARGLTPVRYAPSTILPSCGAAPWCDIVPLCRPVVGCGVSVAKRWDRSHSPCAPRLALSTSSHGPLKALHLTLAPPPLLPVSSRRHCSPASGEPAVDPAHQQRPPAPSTPCPLPRLLVERRHGGRGAVGAVTDDPLHHPRPVRVGPALPWWPLLPRRPDRRPPHRGPCSGGGAVRRSVPCSGAGRGGALGLCAGGGGPTQSPVLRAPCSAQPWDAVLGGAPAVPPQEEGCTRGIPHSRYVAVCAVSAVSVVSVVSVVCGVCWCVVHGAWCVVCCGAWCVVHGVWCMVCGVWGLVHGVWCMVCGVWCVCALHFGVRWDMDW